MKEVLDFKGLNKSYGKPNSCRTMHTFPAFCTITTNIHKDGLHEILKIVMNYGNKYECIPLNSKYDLFF